ncbi:MAG: WD40/YVTN/BNR-like repeat-containing protein [Gemmatimonadaceae bacterium]
MTSHHRHFTFRRAAVWRTTIGLLAALPAVAAAQWQMADAGTRAEFRGLSLAGDHVAWASGRYGTVARSTDGGAQWTLFHVPGADSLDLRSIAALGPDAAVAASAGAAESGQARIFRTTDGGTTWTQVYATRQKGVFLDALAFWDADHGIALSDPVDGKLFLLVTDDGGRSWARVPSDALPPALPGEGAFAASGTCMVVGGTGDVWIGTGGAAHARVYHSSNRGHTWTVSDTPVHAGESASGIFALAFRDAMHGVAVGGDYTKPHAQTMNVAITDDGGRTWHSARGPLVPAFLSGVTYARADTLVAVGLAGTAISTNDGESWTAIDTLPLNAVRAHGSAFRVVAGPRGRLGRWIGTRGGGH